MFSEKMKGWNFLKTYKNMGNRPLLPSLAFSMQEMWFWLGVSEFGYFCLTASGSETKQGVCVCIYRGVCYFFGRRSHGSPFYFCGHKDRLYGWRKPNWIVEGLNATCIVAASMWPVMSELDVNNADLKLKQDGVHPLSCYSHSHTHFHFCHYFIVHFVFLKES